ncbi:MAG: hypothetical protein H6746_19165 [Deltaproteobacteria bacterium]|nr:hypothetical protein [Deltaproteobacteria bacterium]
MPVSGARIAVVALVLAACRSEPAPPPQRPAAPRPASFIDAAHGVRLDPPDATWRFLDSLAAAAADPRAVAGLTDGRACVGLIRSEAPPEAGLEATARARVQSLGFDAPHLSWMEPVYYLGGTAMRFEVSGQREGVPVSMRVTLALAPPDDPKRRLYEVRAESGSTDHVAARRCFDAVTGAFDVVPIPEPAPEAEPEPAPAP